MGQAAEVIDVERAILDERVESLFAAHGWDARAVIETLLLLVDSRSERISFEYVRGRLPDQL